jgi:hypothetical protein
MDRQIHVYGTGAPTVECPYGGPLPALPTSFVLVAPTASGKSVVLLSLLLKFYRGMFDRIWVFSPSIFLDPQYKPLRKYLEAMTDQNKEPLMFEDFDQGAVGKILDDQRAIVEFCRKRSERRRRCASLWMTWRTKRSLRRDTAGPTDRGC